jgi:chitosanase
MVAFSGGWSFTGHVLTATSGTGDFTYGPVTSGTLVIFEVSSPTPSYASAPVLRVASATSGDPPASTAAALAAGHYFSITITPGSTVQSWTPSSLTLNAARGGSATPRSFGVYGSHNGYGSSLGGGAVPSQRTAWTGYNLPLTSIGTISGPLELRFPVAMPTTGSTLEFDDIVVSGDYTEGSPSAPTASFTGDPVSGQAPMVVQFTDASTNTPTSWSWTFGDGGTSTEQHPAHTYTSNGTYTVAMTATNSAGSDTQTRTGYVEVSAAAAGPTIIQSNTSMLLQSAAGTSLACALPAPATAGTLLFATLGVDKSSGTINAPAGGWNLITPTYVDSNVSAATAWKVAAGGETGVTWTWTTAADAAATIAEWNVEGAAVMGTPQTSAVSGTAVTSVALSGATASGQGLAFATVSIDTGYPQQWTLDDPAWTNGYALAVKEVGLGDASAGSNGGACSAVGYKVLSNGTTTGTTMSWTGADQAAGFVSAFSYTGLAGGGGGTGVAIDSWKVQANTATGAKIDVDSAPSASVRVRYSTDSTFETGVVTTGAVTADATRGMSKHTLSGLTGGTQYFYRVQVDGVDSTNGAGSFWTEPTGPSTTKIIFGSCRDTNSNTAAFTRAKNRNPHLVCFTGDIHYQDLNTTDANLYHAALEEVERQSNFQQMNAVCAFDYSCVSDHDYCANASHGSSTGRNTVLGVIRNRFSYVDLASPDNLALYGSRTWGPNVRIIRLDTRAFRSPPGNSDNSSKQMLGTTQENWFVNLMNTATEPLIFIVSDVPWIPGGSQDDHWGSYQTAQNRIVSAVNSSAWGKAVWWCGDAHMLAYDNGSNSPGGSPVWQAAAWDRTGSTKGGPYSGGTLQGGGQFGEVTIVDDGSIVEATYRGIRSDDTVWASHTVTRSAATPVTGTLAGTLPAVAGQLAGTARATGSLGATLPTLTGSLAGASATSSSLAGSLPALTASLSGAVTVTGSTAGQLPVLAGDLAGEVAAPVPAFDTLTEDFSAEDTGKWTGWRAGLAAVGGRLRADADGSYQNFLHSADQYDLTGTFVTVEVPTVPAAESGTEAYVVVTPDGTNANAFGFLYAGGSVIAVVNVAGSATYYGGWPAHSPTDHRWVRLREDAGTCHVETSPNGASGWAALGSFPAPFPVTTLTLRLGAANWNSVVSPGVAEFDNVNLADVGVTGELAGALPLVTGTVAAFSGDRPDVTDPTYKGMAFQITSTAENSTLDWTQAYDYIEDIGDGRGYTGGLVGFTSATFDMEILLQHYSDIAPGNILEKYLDEFAQISALPTQQERNDASHSLLDPGFVPDWQTAATTDYLFRQAQRDERERVYWAPALAQAQADGAGPLGLALYYDVLVNHGPGEDYQSFGGIIAGVKADGHLPPSEGGNEVAFLTAICDARDAVLTEWGDFQVDGRSTIFRKLIDDGNLALVPPFTFSVYGDSFTISDYPGDPDSIVEGSLAGTLPAAIAELAGASTATGAMASTLPALAGEASGVVEVQGSLAAALPALTGSLTGEHGPVTATLAAALPAAQASLDGEATASGALAGTLPAVGGELTGQRETAGAELAATLPALQGSLDGAARATGDLAGTLPAVEASLDGASAVEASLAGVLPAVEWSASSGAVTAEGTLTGTLQPLTGSLAGETGVDGALAGTLPALGGQVVGNVGDDTAAALDATLPPMVGQFAAEVPTAGSLAGQLPPLGCTITAEATVVGTAAGTLPSLDAGLTGTSGDVAAGTVAATLPALACQFAGQLGVTGLPTFTLPAVGGSLNGEVTATGDIGGVLPPLSGTFAAGVIQNTTGTLTGTLPTLTGALTGSSDAALDITVTAWLAARSATGTLAPQTRPTTTLAAQQGGSYLQEQT